MKKFQILTAAVVLAMAMTACVREETFSKVELGKEDFAFSLSKFSTKSTVEAEAPRSFKLGDSGFYLEESVSSLDEQVVDTKGTPIYTENIEKYYPTINVVGYKVGGSDAYVPEASFVYYHESDNSTRKVYAHHYSSDFWPEEGTEQKLWFFLKTPQDYLDGTASDMTYGTSETDGSIEFDYSSPLDGAAQKDILFTSRTLTKAEYFDSPNYHAAGGAPVTFYHALTAVKFRTGHENDGTTKTIITHVEFSGLYVNGHCKVTPTEGKVSKENVVWSNLNTDSSFSMDFENPTYTPSDGADNKDGTYDYSSTDGFGSSWTSAASDQNLNDKDGTKTFWFIPQAMTEDVVLKVTFLVKTPDTPNGQEITHTINLGETLAAQNVEWKAGQLRTYTLKPFDVDVAIFDDLDGLTKSNLHVTNTGNVDEYVRMMLVGNWYDKDGNILVGYKYAGNETGLPEGTDIDEMVSPWFRGDSQWNQYFDDTFKNGLPNGDNPWVFGTGSYFYYPYKIGAGVTLDSGTQALFQTYSLPADKIPTIYLPTTTSQYRVAAEGVHLVMEVVIQAIATTKPDTGEEFADWKAAWSYVTGRDIKEKENANLTTSTEG